MSLREQFEAWMRTSYLGTYSMEMKCNRRDMEIAWIAFQAGHAVNADLLEALESVVNESVVVHDNGKYATVQISSGVLEEAEAAIKKARGEA